MGRQVRTHTLNGEIYNIVIVESGFEGLCDSPREIARNLYIYVGDLTDKRGLQVLIGECLHAENWAQTEEVTHRAGDEIGGLIYRLLRSGQIKIKQIEAKENE